MSLKVDAVYLWCDGSDPKFREEKNILLKKTGRKRDNSEIGDVRFIDNSELKFSLRSIYQQLPWVNHIYIITNKQMPLWLRQRDKITIVDHTQIIPRNLLPTFNSVMIEMYISRIPGLSENFLLFNDDVFINSYLPPEFFFHKNKPIVRLIKDRPKWQFKSIQEADAALNDSSVSSYRKSLINAWKMFSIRHGVSDFYVLTHTVDAFSLSLFDKVLSTYPEMLSRNNTAFREDSNVQRVIFQMEMAKSLGCALQNEHYLSFWEKRFPFAFKEKVNCFEGAESHKTWRRIHYLKPKMFCLNADPNSDPKIKRLSRKNLQKLFPIPSPYEIQ